MILTDYWSGFVCVFNLIGVMNMQRNEGEKRERAMRLGSECGEQTERLAVLEPEK